MRICSRFLAGTLIAVTIAIPALGSAQTAAKVVALQVGGRLPNYTLPDVTGRQVSLDSFQGKAILLSFWSCYTDSCFTSVRVFEELLKEYSARGLVAPTICSEIPPALEKNSYEGLLKNCGTGQLVLVDRNGDLTKKLGITEYPTTYLIDRNHLVWQVIVGVRPLLEDDFRVLVKSLVSE